MEKHIQIYCLFLKEKTYEKTAYKLLIYGFISQISNTYGKSHPQATNCLFYYNGLIKWVYLIVSFQWQLKCFKKFQCVVIKQL